MSAWDSFKAAIGVQGASPRRKKDEDEMPSYGTGISGAFNRVRDVFDANTPQDNFKRQQERNDTASSYFNLPARSYEQEQKDKGIGRIASNPWQRATNTGRAIWEGFSESPEQIGNMASTFSEDTKKANEASSNAQDQYTQTIAKAGKALKDPNITPADRQRWERLLDITIQSSNEHNKDFGERLKQEIEYTDPLKNAAAVASMGFDAATAGVATGGKATVKAGVKAGINQANKNLAKQGAKKTISQLQKEAVKQTSKARRKAIVRELAKQGNKTGLTAAPAGALSPVVREGDEATATDIALGGVAGYGGGFVLGPGMTLAGHGTSKLLRGPVKQGIDIVRDQAGKVKMNIDESAAVRQLNREFREAGTDATATKEGMRNAAELNKQNKGADGGDLKVSNTDGADITPGAPFNPAGRVEPDFVVSVKRADGRTQQYKPKTPEEAAEFKQRIDDARIANGQADDGTAGVRDANNDVWHISSGEFVKDEYSPMAQAPKVNVAQSKPTVKVGRTQKMSELMPDLKSRKKVNTTKRAELAKKHGVQEDTLARLENQYGAEKVESVLNRNADAVLDTPGRQNSKDAFITSELQKQYGKPPVRVQGGEPNLQGGMSAEELASLDSKAPADTPSSVKVRQQADPEVTREIGVEEKRARLNGDDDFLPTLRERSNTPEEYLQSLRTMNGTETPPKQTVKVKNQTEQPEQSAPTDSPLGRIAETFYDDTKGKDVKIGFKALEALGKKVSAQVEQDLQSIGTNFRTVARKVQQAARDGAETLEEAGLTPDEAGILRNAQAEMNYVRRRASLGRKKVGEGDLGDLYLPQQKKGQYGGNKLFEGFIDQAPGNEKMRKNRIDLDDLDYSPETVAEYITRYGDTKAYSRQRIFNAFKRNNPNTEDDMINQATDKMYNLQQKINNLKTKIGMKGTGKRRTTFEGEAVDTAGEMSQIGKDLGREQIVIDDAPKGLLNSTKINSVKANDQPLGDYLGLNRYEDAVNHGSNQPMRAAGDRTELAKMVENRLRTEYDLPEETIDFLVTGVGRMAQTLDDKAVQARVISTYKIAAKQQLMDKLQNVKITNPKLRKEISDLTNQILREGTTEKQLSAKAVRGVLTTTNALFRKFNPSSAMNELGDVSKFRSMYGNDMNLVPDFQAMRDFGLGDIDPNIDPYIKQVQSGKSLKSVLKSINSASNLYRFVETYKAGLVANAARKHYSAQGIVGDELTDLVRRDFKEIALPVSEFTKTFLDDYPLWTQYMSWGLRNLNVERKLAVGEVSGGKLTDMSQRKRIARNVYANLPAKSVFWLASNGLKGTAIMTAIGLTDFTGLTEGDYSGIKEEDKSLYDKTTEVTDRSTVFSLLNTAVQSWEKEQLKNSDKYANANYNPYEDNSLDEDIINLFTPQVVKNVSGANEMREKGYSENKGGRIQYEAPEDWWNTGKSYLFGKNQTENAREYSGNKNIVDRVSEGQNPLVAIADMAKEQVNLQDTDYNRPLTDDYTEAYKNADEDGRTAMLEGGKAYNKFLDDLRDNSPQDYQRYIDSLQDHVNPEYWTAIAGGKTGKVDLNVFNTLKQRKKQLSKDLGEAYDPLYDLPDDQARAVIQQKSVATGDDIALRNVLYKEDWYNDYMDKVKEYYENKTDTDDEEYEQTERVKNWYDLNDQYNSLRATKTDDGAVPSWAEKYPSIYQQKLINEEYGFDSEESKNFFRTKGDLYKAEKEVYDAENLALINKMREIEGETPMSAEQYAQATSIENTDDDEGGGYGSGYGSGGGRHNVRSARAGNVRMSTPKPATIKIRKVTRNQAYKPKKIKVTRRS